ncbi:hypothetical protein GALMADRAFT_264491 [Galerina marginata CBS 339.88]|uniref:Uncharacterized protein n=1 Tax=Galerina marginata (strain CBS 339.88) TaxID=685588 RepID=A0A067TDW9_GALM3|nr:hypothetical protein GALMADRAFT_264491 [Galerina marginata CBS 339.88]
MSFVKAGSVVEGRYISRPRAMRKRQTVRPRQGLVPTHPCSSLTQTAASKRQKTKRRSLKRLFIILWKRVTQPRFSRASRRFSFIPPGFTRVDPVPIDPTEAEHLRLRAQRRQAGYWGSNATLME